MIRPKAGSLNKYNIIKDFTINMYGYKLTDSYYLKLVSSEQRSYYFDKLLCKHTAKYFESKQSALNLHRWSLDNKSKTKYETNYLGKNIYIYIYIYMQSSLRQ